MEKFKSRTSKGGGCCAMFKKRQNRLVLAQHATSEECQKRSAELAFNQVVYIYESPPSIPNVAFIKGPYTSLPGQTPSLLFKIKVSFASMKILANNYRINGKVLEMFRVVTLFFNAIALDLSKPGDIDKFADKFSEQSQASHERAEDLESKFVAARDASTLFEERSTVLAPYRALYRVLNPPIVSNVFLEDRVFARLRTAGYNPISLFRVDDHTLPFSIESDIIIGTQNDTFQNALRDKRIYALDFSHLSAVAQDPTSQKKLVACQALFLRPLDSGDLMPLAIRLLESDELVISPRILKLSSRPAEHGTRWDIAKHVVNTCDAIHHELVAHLGRTHLLMEAFVAATMRQLPSTHPLHALLVPHLEGTVFINERASKNLVAPGGDVDRIFAGDIRAVMEWCSKRVLNSRFNELFPHVELEKRGVNDPSLNFPYRDDAIAHFDALIGWVGGYLRYFYKSDADVVADTELSAWADELCDKERGRVKGFGDDGNGKILTLDYLIQAVTFLIFTASVQHAAVNFPQLSLMSYAPALAGALWGPLPPSGAICDVRSWKEILPPVKLAMEQIDILGVIGAVYYTRLGHYKKSQFADADKSCNGWPGEIKAAHASYMKQLKKIDQIIVERERYNDLQYDYLRPGRVPQSINI